jgi:hypothetical protein
MPASNHTTRIEHRHFTFFLAQQRNPTFLSFSSNISCRSWTPLWYITSRSFSHIWYVSSQSFSHKTVANRILDWIYGISVDIISRERKLIHRCSKHPSSRSNPNCHHVQTFSIFKLSASSSVPVLQLDLLKCSNYLIAIHILDPTNMFMHTFMLSSGRECNHSLW